MRSVMRLVDGSTRSTMSTPASATQTLPSPAAIPTGMLDPSSSFVEMEATIVPTGRRFDPVDAAADCGCRAPQLMREVLCAPVGDTVTAAATATEAAPRKAHQVCARLRMFMSHLL